MTFSEMFMGLATPMAKKVLTALGFGTITYTGASAVLNTVATSMKDGFAGLSGDVLALLTMAGVFEAFAIGIGGISGAIAMMAFKRMGLITGTASA
jgi:hypothetical protein